MDDRLRELLTTDSLIDTGRAPRRSAVEWLEDIQMRICLLNPCNPFPELSSIQNHISLLSLMLQGAEQARLQCWRQIRFARTLGRSEEIVQPWINLARLDRIQRRRTSARRRLLPLQMLAAGEPATLASKLVEATHVRQLAISVCAAERFQWARDTRGQLSLHLQRLPYLFAASNHPALAEQRVVGGALLGDDEVLQSGLMNHGWFAASHTRFVGMYYRAVHAWYRGQKQPRDRFFERLSQSATGIEPDTDHAWLRLLHRAQLFASGSGCDQMAAELGSSASAVAKRLGDVEYIVKVAHASCATGRCNAGWRQHAARSGYQQFKGIPPFRTDPVRQAHACAKLREIVSDLDRVRRAASS